MPGLLRCSLAASFACLISPAVALATWADPEAVSPVGQDATNPQVAVDPGSGRAFMVWSRQDTSGVFRVQARVRTPDGGLTPTRTLSASGADADTPQVAVGAGGSAVIVWARFDGSNVRIQDDTLSPTGAAGTAKNVSLAGHDASEPEVAAGTNVGAEALLAWREFDGSNYRAVARPQSSAGALGSTQTLSASGRDADNPQVATDPAGDGVVVWQRFDSVVDRVELRARPANGSWTSQQFAGPPLVDAIDPQVGLDSSGNAIVVWRANDGSNYRTSLLKRSSSGTLGSVRTLSASGQDAIAPQVAVDPGGDAVVVWQRSDGTNSRIQIRAFSAAGVVSANQNLSAAGFNAINPQVGVDSSGNAVAVWLGGGANNGIRARTRSSAGTLGSTATLIQSIELTDFPQVGVAASGGATSVWGELLGAHKLIEAAGGP